RTEMWSSWRWRSAVRRARLDDGSCEQQRRDGDQLRAQDQPVHVDRGAPVDLVPADHVGARRPRVDAEPGAHAGPLALRAFAATAARAALDTRRRDHGDPVLLVRVPEDPLHAHGVPRLLDRLPDVALPVHGTTSSRSDGTPHPTRAPRYGHVTKVLRSRRTR